MLGEKCLGMSLYTEGLTEAAKIKFILEMLVQLHCYNLKIIEVVVKD